MVLPLQYTTTFKLFYPLMSVFFFKKSNEMENQVQYLLPFLLWVLYQSMEFHNRDETIPY